MAAGRRPARIRWVAYPAALTDPAAYGGIQTSSLLRQPRSSRLPVPRTIRDSIRINDWRRRIARGLMRLLFGAPAQLSNEPLPRTGIYRIVICHISHTLGNALLLTPLIQELEATWPGAEIDIVTRSQVGQEL